MPSSMMPPWRTKASYPQTGGKSPICHVRNSGMRSLPASSSGATKRGGRLIGVMGIQDVQDVTLIRHAYVRTARRNKGIGGMLLKKLFLKTDRPILIGTWADAVWAIRFYEKHGFRLVTPQEKVMLLNRYWSIPERQVETSVVLADSGAWMEG